MCMSLYKSVNATLFVYGFYKIGPLMTDFSYPSLFTISTGKALCNIQIDKQENKQTNISSFVISQNTIQDTNNNKKTEEFSTT